MTRKRVKLMAATMMILIVVCLGTFTASAQTSKVSIDALTSETQKGSDNVDKMILVWWIPEEYWRVTMSQNGTVSTAQIDEFLKIVSPYQVFVVADGMIGALGGITYKPEEEIRKSIQLIDRDGSRYAPIGEDKIGSDAKNFLSIVKPVLANALGPVGQNMHIYLFPAKNKENRQIMEATKEGAFTIRLGENSFTWKLPLGSLLPSKVCPVDGEELNGAWKYCPWHGEMLKPKPLK